MLSIKEKVRLLKNFILKNLKNYTLILIIYILFSLWASLISYFSKPSILNDGTIFTKYNNYIIFKQSYYHLTEHRDLYSVYPNEYWDLYKYTPTFSVLFSPLSLLPDLLGLIFWNLLNALLLFFAIKYLPSWLSENKKKFMVWFVLIELMTSMQNEQSNGLIAGLIILSFVLLERKKFLLATLLIAIGIFIKPFGIVSVPLLLLFSEKLKCFLYTALWCILLFLLPMFVVSFSELCYIYESWVNLLLTDYSSSLGLSVMGCLNSWFGVAKNYTISITSVGVILFCLPLLRFKMYGDSTFKFLFLSSILLWVVIFNHKAESPTFVIALTGIAIWFIAQPRNILNIILLVLAFIFASLSNTDVFPRFIRNEFFKPYMIKAVPCIIIWFKILYDQLFLKARE